MFIRGKAEHKPGGGYTVIEAEMWLPKLGVWVPWTREMCADAVVSTTILSDRLAAEIDLGDADAPHVVEARQ